MKLKMVKISSIAAALVLGCGISSAGQAAVVIVTHAPPPPPPPASTCVWNARNNTVVCYRAGVRRVFYPVSHQKICFPEGCYWQNCYHTYYGTECHRLY